MRKLVQAVRAGVLGLLALFYFKRLELWRLMRRRTKPQACSESQASSKQGSYDLHTMMNVQHPLIDEQPPTHEPELTTSDTLTAAHESEAPSEELDEQVAEDALADDSRSQQLLMELEAILFVASEPVERAALARALNVDQAELARIVLQYRSGLHRRGFRLQEQAGALQLVSAPETAAVLQRFLGEPQASKLSNAALEVLAIVAYRQPVTRAHIEAIRGVDSSGVLRSLQARELIIEVGRAETLGRPVLYGTTALFLQTFGIQHLSDLPPLSLPEPDDERTD